MSGTEVRVGPEWLRLREGADAAARSTALARALRPALGGGALRVVHDLGAGNGAMGRWLSPLLDGPQHWVLHDRDPDLLWSARADPPAARGRRVTLETLLGDVTRLAPGALAGATLVTASALLDMLTGEELRRLVGSCVESGAPTLLTLSVSGRVRLWPADPLDAALGAAFDDHQRRLTDRGRLLGPDAGRVAATLFHRLGARVVVRHSPWRLGPDTRTLTAEWLRGWVGAAVQQRPDLDVGASAYLARRTEQLAGDGLRVLVDHLDLLATPGGARR